MPLKGYKQTQEHKQNISLAITPELRKIWSEKKLGKKNPMFGKVHNESHRINLSKATSEENNPAWKGDGVGYRALHHWVTRKLGKPKGCSHCHKMVEGQGIHWANSDGKYERDLECWVRLCAKCHKNHDKINNLFTRKNVFKL